MSDLIHPSHQFSAFSNLTFDNTFSQLPEVFYTQIAPIPVKNPSPVKINSLLAKALGFDEKGLYSQHTIEVFAGNRLPEKASPLAMVYAGHQFGQFVDKLGDGRANLLGEVISLKGERFDIQLKGSGQTPYSRKGDGRATMGAALREYIVSEAMYALGISTTRSLALIATGEKVERETMLPGAVLTRVAKSHIRVGTFEYFKCRDDVTSIKVLADHVINNYYPKLKQENNRYTFLLEAVINKQAELIASWQHVGFIHGVMNTDNTSIVGETLDYGPCAFMDEFKQAKVFSYIDRNGRYSYANQPYMGLWNMIRFAETLLPLLDENAEAANQKATHALSSFEHKFHAYWIKGMRQKIGLCLENKGVEALIKTLLTLMEARSLDFTHTFTELTNALASHQLEQFLTYLGKSALSITWVENWKARLALEKQTLTVLAEHARQINPIYIPRNHKIEEAIQLAVDHNDYAMMHEMNEALMHPYQENEKYKAYRIPPKKSERVESTFCGT